MNEQILKPLVADLDWDTLEMPEPRVVGCTVQEVCELSGEVVILGIPEEAFDDEGNSLHSCDQMGCGMCHVIYRFNLDESAENAQLREKLAADDIDEFMDKGQPEAVASFTLAMKKKLRQKSLEGYHGWDEPVYAELLKEKLYEHIKREEANGGQLVDIANLAMMLWNLEQKAIIDGKEDK